DLDGDGVQDAGEPLITWTATVTGPSFPGGQAFTITNGSLTLADVLSGSYTVVEATDPDYVATSPASQSATVAGNGSATVTFHNQPRVNIQVNKTLIDNGATSVGSGWTFTLTGCGVASQSKTTGASGSVSFTGLPPAAGCVYTVTETTQATWVPDAVSQQAAPVTAGSTAVLTFVNRRFAAVILATVVPGTTAVATPTAPPATVTEAVRVSSPSPTASPPPAASATPQPVTGDATPAATRPSGSTVSGERPGDPPGPPSTGSGLRPDGTGETAVAAGLLLLVLTLAVYTMRVRRG
ncbi:MAG: hypothetical protein ACKVT1_17305, partial [Dehalococcoidia bacterium]